MGASLAPVRGGVRSAPLGSEPLRGTLRLIPPIQPVSIQLSLDAHHPVTQRLPPVRVQLPVDHRLDSGKATRQAPDTAKNDEGGTGDLDDLGDGHERRLTISSITAATETPPATAPAIFVLVQAFASFTAFFTASSTAAFSSSRVMMSFRASSIRKPKAHPWELRCCTAYAKSIRVSWYFSGIAIFTS